MVGSDFKERGEWGGCTSTYNHRSERFGQWCFLESTDPGAKCSYVVAAVLAKRLPLVCNSYVLYTHIIILWFASATGIVDRLMKPCGCTIIIMIFMPLKNFCVQFLSWFFSFFKHGRAIFFSL